MPPVTDEVREKIIEAFGQASSIRAAAKLAGVSFDTAKKYAPAMTPGVTDLLAIDLIRMDGATQPRAAMKEETIAEYEESMREGAKFPPPVVFFDGETYWLADGFHRVQAAIRAGLNAIEVDIRQGTRRDAILYSVGANATHGERRSNADKRRAVETLMRDEEWSQLSNREIARRCGVAHALANDVRDDLSGRGIQIDPLRTVERNGTTYQQDTGRGTRKPSIPLAPIAPRDTGTVGAAINRDEVLVEGDNTPIGPETGAFDPDTDPESEAWPSLESLRGEPADIVAGRRNGTIPADAVVEVTEVEGHPAPEPVATPAEMTDAEYLESLPARPHLAEHVRKRFDVEALLFRAITPIRLEFSRKCVVLTNRAKKESKGHIGPWMARHFWYLRSNDPTRWQACKDCSGSGSVPLIGQCPACKGEGYHA